MANKTLVRSDNLGLFVRAGGYVARPGDVTGYSHAYDQSDGGLKAGDYVKAYHLSGSPLTQITLSDGRKLVWTHEYTWKQDQEYRKQWNMNIKGERVIFNTRKILRP